MRVAQHDSPPMRVEPLVVRSHRSSECADQTPTNEGILQGGQTEVNWISKLRCAHKKRSPGEADRGSGGRAKACLSDSKFPASDSNESEKAGTK